jgi:DNA-binding ferritin-like protein (Dps family)
LRFGLNGEKPLTLEEVSERIGKTRERVRQIENRAIEKIRGMLQSEGYNIRKGHTNKNIDERLQRNYTQQINSPSEDEQDKESRLEKITQRIKFNGRSRKVEKSYNSYEQDKKSVLDEYYSGTNEIKELSIKLGIKEWKIIKILSEEGLEFEGRKNSNSLSEREIPKDYNTPRDAVVSEEDFKKAQRTKQLEEISKKKQEN